MCVFLGLQADPSKLESFLSRYEEELKALLGPDAQIDFIDILQGSTIVVTQITLPATTTIDVNAAASTAADIVNSVVEGILGSSDDNGSGNSSSEGSGSSGSSEGSGSSGSGSDNDSGEDGRDKGISPEGQRRHVLSVPSRQYESAFYVMAGAFVAGMIGLAGYFIRPSSNAHPSSEDLHTAETDVEIAGLATSPKQRYYAPST